MTIVTIGEVKVRVHLLLIIMTIVFALCGQLLEVSIVLMSVILHELCHVVTARMLGYRVTSIELLPFGGVAKIEEPDRCGLQAFAVVAAGPIGSALCGLGGYVLAGDYGDYAAMRIWTEVNTMLALWNLVPAYPLDGGRIMQMVWQSCLNPRESLRRTVRISRMIATVLIFYSGYRGIVYGEILVSVLFMAVMIWRMAGRESVRCGLVPFVAMASKRRRLAKVGHLKTEWYTVRSERSIATVIALFRTEVYTMIRVTDRDGNCCAMLSETMIWQGLERYDLTDRIEKFCETKE